MHGVAGRYGLLTLKKEHLRLVGGNIHNTLTDIANHPLLALASLSTSDLCEILQAHSADEIVRLCNLRQNLQPLTVKP